MRALITFPIPFQSLNFIIIMNSRRDDLIQTRLTTHSSPRYLTNMSLAAVVGLGIVIAAISVQLSIHKVEQGHVGVYFRVYN